MSIITPQASSSPRSSASPVTLIRQHSTTYWSNHFGFCPWILFIHFCLSLLKPFLIKTIKYAKSSSISYALKIRSAWMEKAEEALYLVAEGGVQSISSPGTSSSGVI
jgi:hypothetical protein